LRAAARPLPRRRTAQPEPVLPPKRKLMGWALLGGFGFGYLAVWFLFFPGFGRDAIVTVPDLRGKTVGDARGVADDHGLTVVLGNTLPNPFVPAGHVLTQQPLPGQEAARGAVVHLIMSGGPVRRKVPDLAGLDLDEVKAMLARFGFGVAVTAVVDASYEGKVLGVQPAPGAEVPLPATIQVTVSAGPPKEPTPNLLGFTLGQAQAVLDSAGLHLGRIGYDSASTVPLGSISAQRPAPGDSVHQGGGVSVTVSGTAPPPPIPIDSAGAAAIGPSVETPPPPAPRPAPPAPVPARQPARGEARKPAPARPAPAPPPQPKAAARPPASGAARPPAARPPAGTAARRPAATQLKP
jgi:beta-lactam-binding protein with PASTA domain